MAYMPRSMAQITRTNGIVVVEFSVRGSLVERFVSPL
jgi:hypothetical protein